MEDSPDAKKPCKGILKTSSSFDKPTASYRKSAKFDELNVLQTLHPADKDYGHMKIEEPKTPFNFETVLDRPELDADLLAEKLRIAANTQAPAFGDDENLSDDDFPETDEERVRRLEFEKRRKAHYNEYEAVRLARKLIEEEHLDEEDDEKEDLASEEGENAEGNKSKTARTEESEIVDTATATANTPGTERDCTETDGEYATPAADSGVVYVRPMDIDAEENAASVRNSAATQ